MRAVVQRVSSARVEVDAEIVGSIGPGLLIYLGAGKADTDGSSDWMVQKVEGLRIFEDAAEKMSLSVRDVRGSILVVSQFTLYGDVRKGRRPSFDGAADPDHARALYERFVTLLRQRGLPVETGRFRAAMEVFAQVSGPVTIIIDSERTF